MAHDGSITFHNDTIRFEGAFRPQDLGVVLAIQHELLAGKPPQLTLDFRDCTSAFPNSMLPLIASMARLRRLDYKIYAVLPTLNSMRNMFSSFNWAHYLSPIQYQKSDDITDRHLALTQYTSIEDHGRILRQIIDVILRTIAAPRSSIAALEWAISEVMDNVIMHASSPDGGFVQLAAFTNKQHFAFCVADNGRGILESLREGYPTLQSDKVAIQEAVRAGVTRNSQVGQGNGLSGSLELAIQTGGRFGILSGAADTLWVGDEITAHDYPPDQVYYGTMVDVQIPYGADIDVPKILNQSTKTPSYSGETYTPTDFLETRYLSADGAAMILRLSAETIGFGTRLAGSNSR